MSDGYIEKNIGTATRAFAPISAKTVRIIKSDYKFWSLFVNLLKVSF